jgi:eukaryotic-like serine/threonine-protein kinase
MSPDEPRARLTPERWREVEAIFLAARDRGPGERAAFLEQACGTDVALRHEVESLLAADEVATGFLEPPTMRGLLIPDFETALRAKLADRYALERELGRGGMATVYLAQDVRHHRQVAIKVLHPELGAVLGAERFLREIGIAARLSHPHILPLHDSGALDLGLGRPVLFYAMPYVRGRSLRERLREELQLPLDEAIGVASQVAGALDHAHRQGVIHRDIKPENILLQGGHAVLADFGIARALDAAGGDHLTDSGLTIGTPAYMSPEQSAGSTRLDGRTDIYALGCVLYEMLGGQPPFPGPTPQAILARHAVDPVPSLRTLRPTASHALAQVVTRALAKVPSDRFPTAGDFAEALAAAPTVQSEALPSAGRRRRRLAAAVATLAGLAILASGVAAVRARRSHEVEARRVAADLAGEDQYSIAVLPFVNLSPKKEDEYFSDGMTEELINALSRVEGLRVAARASAFAFKGKSPDPREVSEKLHVATVLDGSVRKAGNRLRVSVELVSARDGRRLWFDTYDRTMTDVFSVQEEVARAITTALGLKLATPGSAPVVLRPTGDMDAYTLYLKGRYHSYAFDNDERRLAVEYFRMAVEKDPGYALAWAGLADGYTLLAIALPRREIPALREKARAAALRAVARDSTLAEAYVALANVQYYFDWDWGPAEQNLRRAIALNPNNALAHRWYSELLTMLARYPEAVVEAERAERLDPLNKFMVLGTIWAYTTTREYDKAADAARRLAALDSTDGWTNQSLGRVQLLGGRATEGLANLEKALEISKGNLIERATGPGDPFHRLNLAWAYAVTGQREKARLLLSGVNRDGERAWPPCIEFAKVYAALGDLDGAFAWLERGYAAREDDVPFIAARPELDPLRGDPRLTSLLRRMRLPAPARDQ